MAVVQKSLSFSEVVKDRPAAVRMSDDGLLSAVDLVMLMTGVDNSAANQDLKRLKPQQFNAGKFVIRSKHRWVSAKDALELVRVVKPAVNQHLRGPIREILKRSVAEGGELMDEDHPAELTMPFDAIMAGASVRFVTIEGVQYLSIIDLIKVICNKDGNQAGEVWRRMSENHKNEVQAFCLNFVFPGRGQQKQDVITFPGALKLVMFLGGEKAAEFRTKVVSILSRYFAGDPSLLDDIQANSQSNAPLSQFARASLGMPEEAVKEQDLIKRRRLTDELAQSYVNMAQSLEMCRAPLLEHIQLQERLANVGCNSEEAKMKVNLKYERAYQKLQEKKQKSELEYIKAKKALEADSPPPPAAPASAEATTTVLKVYHANKPAFSLLQRDQTKPFLIRAGHLARQAYITQYGRQPEKVFENGLEVNSFPLHTEGLVMNALRESLRETTAGSGQSTLQFSVVVPRVY